MDKTEMLADLSNVVRMIGNARPGTYDSIAHHCASFIRTHHAEIEAMARDAERYVKIRTDLSVCIRYFDGPEVIFVDEDAMTTGEFDAAIDDYVLIDAIHNNTSDSHD